VVGHPFQHHGAGRGQPVAPVRRRDRCGAEDDRLAVAGLRRRGSVVQRRQVERAQAGVPGRRGERRQVRARVQHQAEPLQLRQVDLVGVAGDHVLADRRVGQQRQHGVPVAAAGQVTHHRDHG
jgi:hypothetical protein